MATGEYALVTWAALAAEFGYLADEQAKVERLIDAATARMEMEAKHKILARDYAGVILDGSGRDILLLPQFPLNSVLSVHIDTSRVFGDSTLTPATDYMIDRDAGLIRLFSGTFPRGYGVVKISYNAGYSEEHEFYAAIVGACKELVHTMKTRWAGGIGKRTETNADGMSVGYELDLPMSVHAVIELIKRHDR